MPAYNYLIHPYHHGFFEAPTPEENTVMEEHLGYLKAAAERGIVLLAGACLDDTFELVVFRAKNDEDASAFMFNDPLVKEDVAAAELHPMRISLAGKPSPEGEEK